MLTILFTALLFCCAGAVNADELLVNANEVSHDVKDGVANLKGNVEVHYGAIVLKCNEAQINQESADFVANGDVEIRMDDGTSWRSQSLKGNFKSKAISFGPYRLDGEVWHAGGDDAETASDGSRILHNTWLSTCDCATPHYSIGANKIVYHEDDRTFTAKHAVLRLFGVPIFYFPMLYGSTDNTTGIIVKPGYSGKRGIYLRLGRIWKHGESGDSQLFADLMSKRGIALGESTTYNTGNREIATDIYGLHDRDTTETESGWDRRFKSKDDRYRIHLYWREMLNDEWTLRLNFDKLSDISMLEDWFRRDYRHWHQPKSFADLSYDGSWFNFALDVRPRVNTFYTVGERLPEARLVVPQMRLYDDFPLDYASENSAGFYSMKWRNNERSRASFIDPYYYDETIHGDPADYSAFRADTLHTFKLPFDIGDAITLTPRASFRATSYSRTSKRKISEEQLADVIDADNPDRPRIKSSVVNYDREGGSRTRFATEFGIEAHTKFIGDWDLGILHFGPRPLYRHVIEPYANYTFAPSPSVDRDNLYFFDEIDRLTRQNFLRLGLDQHWQYMPADGNGEIKTFMSWENYFDLHFDRGEETDRYPGDWGSRFTISIDDHLSFNLASVYDIGAGNLQRGEIGFHFSLPEEEFIQFGTRYVYRNKHRSRSAYSMGSSLVDFSGESSYIKKHFESADTISTTLTIPFNSITSLEINTEYDFENNRFAEHSYYLTRQMHCWTLVAGVGWEYGDFAAMIMLRLTAFPNVKLDLNI